MTYKGWTIHVTPTSITATKDGEELTIRTTDMKLMKKAIRRRNDLRRLPSK